MSGHVCLQSLYHLIGLLLLIHNDFVSCNEFELKSPLLNMKITNFSSFRYHLHECFFPSFYFYSMKVFASEMCFLHSPHSWVLFLNWMCHLLSVNCKINTTYIPCYYGEGYIVFSHFHLFLKFNSFIILIFLLTREMLFLILSWLFLFSFICSILLRISDMLANEWWIPLDYLYLRRLLFLLWFSRIDLLGIVIYILFLSGLEIHHFMPSWLLRVSLKSLQLF